MELNRKTHEPNGNDIIVLTSDEKQYILKLTQELFFAAKQMHDWINDDSLTHEMQTVLTSTMEHQFVNIARVNKYENELAKEQEQRYLAIRKANETIAELTQKLGSTKPIDGLKEQLEIMDDTVRNWWRDVGFRYVAELDYSARGNMVVQFGFSLDFMGLDDEHLVTENEERIENIDQLEKLGYDIVYDNRAQSPELKDSENNRQRLLSLITTRFPSARVMSFKSRLSPSKNEYTLTRVETIIRKLDDIQTK